MSQPRAPAGASTSAGPRPSDRQRRTRAPHPPDPRTPADRRDALLAALREHLLRARSERLAGRGTRELGAG